MIINKYIKHVTERMKCMRNVGYMSKFQQVFETRKYSIYYQINCIFRVSEKCPRRVTVQHRHSFMVYVSVLHCSHT